MPALWISFLSWAGIKAGVGLDQAINNSGKATQKGTSDGISTTKSVAK